MENKNSKALFHNILIIGIGTILTKLISFIMTPFYSSWLSADEYGIYDLIASYVSLCVPFITLQLEQAVYRFSISNKKFSKSYYKKSEKFVSLTSVIVAVVAYFIMKAIGFSTDVTVAFILYFVALAHFNLCTEYLRGIGKLEAYSAINIVMGFVTIMFSVLFLKVLNFGAAGLLLVYALACFISFLIAQIAFKPLRSSEEDDTSIKNMLSYSLPLIPNSISWWITNVSDRTTINILLGSYYNGVYAICCKIPTMVSLLFSIFNLSFQQVAFQTVRAEERRDYFNKLVKKVIRILFTGSFVIISITPLVYHGFIKDVYWEGILCVPFLVGGAIFLSIAQYMGDILLVKNNTKPIGTSTVCAAVFNIFFNILAIHIWGVVGAAISTMISYIIMFGIRTYVNRDLIIIKDMAIYISVYSLIFTIVSAFVLYFKDNDILMVATTVVLTTTAVIINKDIILLILEKIKRNRN